MPWQIWVVHGKLYALLFVCRKNYKFSMATKLNFPWQRRHLKFHDKKILSWQFVIIVCVVHGKYLLYKTWQFSSNVHLPCLITKNCRVTQLKLAMAICSVLCMEKIYIKHGNFKKMCIYHVIPLRIAVSHN